MHSNCMLLLPGYLQSFYLLSKELIFYISPLLTIQFCTIHCLHYHDSRLKETSRTAFVKLSVTIKTNDSIAGHVSLPDTSHEYEQIQMQMYSECVISDFDQTGNYFECYLLMCRCEGFTKLVRVIVQCTTNSRLNK